MMFTKKLSVPLLAALLMVLIPSPVYAQKPKSLVGASIVATIGLSCTAGSLASLCGAYSKFKEWWVSSQEFNEVTAELTLMGGTVKEWSTYQHRYGADIIEYHLEAKPGKDFDAVQKEHFKERSQKLIELFHKKEQTPSHCAALIGLAAGLGVVGGGLLWGMAKELSSNSNLSY